MTTSYFYGLNDAMLIPGRSYAWQVQAVNQTGRDLFKNQGNSEVRSFKYGDECLPITNLGAEALGTDRIRITWEGKWNHNQYVAQIRETREEEWINYGTNIETKVVYDLKANTEYQIRVLPSCGAIEGTAENTLTLSTPEQDVQDLDCGAESDLPIIENREPIEQLNPGDRITAAGFTVILTEVIKAGNTYTGMGLIEVPLFNSARVEAMLNDIQVNTDKQLIGGTVESTLNPNGPFILDMDPDEELSEEGENGEGNNEEEDIDDLPETDIDIEGEIADVEYNEEDSTITVTDTEGNTTEIDPKTADENEDGNVVIEDNNGNVYVVDEDGEVSGPHNSGGEQGDSEEIWFEYKELQYQSGTEINLSDNDSSHLITLIDNDGEEELNWSVLNGDEDITDEIFLENPTNTETANIVLPDDIDELELKIKIGEAYYSISLNNYESNGEPISGISRDPDILVINNLTSPFTSSEERLGISYTYMDSLELNNSKIEIFKINEEDTTLVIFYDDLEKGESIEFIDTQDDTAGWSGKGTDNNFVEAGEYLLRITVSVDESFNNGFEDYETFIVNETESSDEVYDYFVTDDDAWYREKESPYSVITPEPSTNILPQGLQVSVLEIVQDEEGNEVTKMKLKETEEIEYTTLSNISKVSDFEIERKYKFIEDFTALNLPISENEIDVIYKDGEEIIADKYLGEFVKVKGVGNEIEGHWIKKSAIIWIDLINEEEFLEETENAVKVGSKYSGNETSYVCNICVRSALLLMKEDRALFPKEGSAFYDVNSEDEVSYIKGFITNPGRANNIKEDFDKLASKIELDSRFSEVKKDENEEWENYFKILQDKADKGEIVTGVMLNSSGTSGHIMMITPGGLINIDVDNPNDQVEKWGASFTSRGILNVPRVLECGTGARENEAPLCRNVDRKGALERLKWYEYQN